MTRKLLFLFCLLFSLSFSTARAAVLYVDGTGGNNGNLGTGSWGNAKKDIQNAINAAAAGDEIWVKAGTYLPTEDANGGTSQRDKTFYITTKDVKLYGGFAGTETLLSERNPAANVTTLSGNLDAGGNNDAYHVMLTYDRTSACVVDGFTIRDGRADVNNNFNLTAPNIDIYGRYGGGMHNRSSNPTVRNCVFLSNTASSGAGMYNNNCSPVVSNCVFSGNAGGFGGGLYYLGSNTAVSNCVFVSNTADYGGGMYIVGSTLAISSCTFRGNAVYNFARGGGIYMGSGSAGGTISNCILYGNTGGPVNQRNIYKEAGAGTLTVSNTIIGDYDAGATNNYSVSNITTADPLFVNTASPAGADGVFRTADDGLRVSCASPARDAGTGTTPTTDILGNARVGVIDLGAYELQSQNSACPLYVDGTRPDNSGNGYGWASAKKDVQAAINAADAGAEIWVKAGTYLPTEDANGNASPTDPRDKTFYITTKDVKLYGGFAGNETLLSQRNPTTNLTTLSGDLDGAGGTDDAYHVLVTINRTSACVVDGFTMSGGRATGSNGFYVTSPNALVYKNYGGGMYNFNSSSVVSGCTFSSNTSISTGGGMYNFNSSSVVSSCTFSSNTSSGAGGGMYNTSSSPTISSCTFSANMSSGAGGGMYNTSSDPVVSSCTFSANASTSNGGGMYNNNSSPVVSSCTFSSNTATYYGGGMFNVSSSLAMSSCVFSANSASNGGGMYSNNDSNLMVSSCVFSANTATYYGGGMYISNNAGGSITNSILYGNSGSPANPANQQNIYKAGPSVMLTVSYSLVGDYDATATNNYTASNILVADPLFVDAASAGGADGIFGTADDGLRLQSCSPALNAGTGTAPATDISGNSRVGAMDLGAYEYQGIPSATLAATTTTDNRTQQVGSPVAFGSCGATIGEVLSTGANPVSGLITATVYVQPTAPTVGQTAYVRRYYDISTALFPSIATARITLYFTQADFNDYNNARGSLPPLPMDATDAAGNKANLRVTQEHGTSATGAPGSYSGWAGAGPAKVLITPTSVKWNAFLSRWEVVFPVTGFSGFFVTSAISTPLPLELLRFSGKRVGENTNQLDWATGEEEIGTLFVITRSGDAKSFAPIGVVSGKGGSGSAYRFMDSAPLMGDNYYRLQIKESGKPSYSQTVLVKGSEATSGVVALSPNPATDRVTVVCSTAALEGSQASVWSARGRLMTTFVLARETVLDVSEWTAGVYLLRLADGSTLRLIKQ